MQKPVEDYEDALNVLRGINRRIGSAQTLTQTEKLTLGILARVAGYIYMRIEHGSEVFQVELREAGKSTQEFDQEKQ
jgi:hypothetical protein